jgi:Holliday junction resolvasome RuvABC endonuclease subunit
MRSAFGVISLLVVLVVVLFVARHQLRIMEPAPGAVSSGAAGIGAAPGAQAEQQVRKALADAAAVQQRQMDAADKQ